MSRMKFEVKFYGLKELSEALDSLEPRMQRNILRGAVKEGARVVREVTEGKAALATNGSGILSRSIAVSTRGTSTKEVARRGYVTAGIKVQSGKYGRTRKGRDGKVVGYVYNPARIWHFIEFGTAARTQKKFKRRVGSMKPHPFIRPAMTQAEREVLQAMVDYCGKRFTKIAAKTLAGFMLAND